MTDEDKNPLDVWLLFDEPDDEHASHEANIYLTDDKRFRVEWSNTSVGQIRSREFDTYAAASAWLEASGYRDFSS